MLTKTTKITMEGKSVVNEAEIAVFRAAINSENPADIVFTSNQLDKAMCKEHRLTVRADEAEFEDIAYAKQDELLAELKTTEE